jgi:hypothetical protein
MRKQKKKEPGFVVCLKNRGYEASLERNKIYPSIPDPDAEQDGDIRVVDESGEDYLYPANWFYPLEIPDVVEESVLKAS